MSCRSQTPHRHGSRAAEPLRMLHYYTDIRLAGHSGPIRQFLIYIGADRLTMPAGLDEPDLLVYRYSLVDMHRVDCAGLLAQDNPIYIVRRLRELLGANERGFRQHITMLEILSKNRDLQAQVKETEHMLTKIDIESLPSFTIDFERGEKKGEEKGLEEGKA